MNKTGANVLNHKSPVGSRTDSRFKGVTIRQVVEVVAAIAVGVFFGALVLFSRELPADWSGLVILAAIAPTVVLLIGDLDKIILSVLVVDVALGLDIALAHQEGSSGGLTGYVISLMSIVLVVGYVKWLARGSSDRQIKIRPSWDTTLPALVYLVLIAVSAVSAIDKTYSLFSVFLYLQFFLMYLYMINHIDSYADLRLIYVVLIVIVVLESLLMLAQYLTGFELSALSIASRAGESDIVNARGRIGGTLGPPNTAATFLAVSLTMIYAFYLSEDSPTIKKLALLALSLGVAALLTTLSRMGWFVCGLGFLIVTTTALLRRYKLTMIWPLAVIGLLVAIGFSSQIVERYTNSGQESAMSRLWYNELSLNVIEDKALTGIGANNQQFIMDDIDYLPLELLGRDRTLIHNKYLSTWVEIGVFGFLALLWMLVAAARRALLSVIKSKNAAYSILMAGLLGALVAYSLHMLVATFTGRIRLQLLWLLLALIVATSQLIKASDCMSSDTLSVDCHKPANSVGQEIKAE